jgi:hypothetical protein
MPPFNFFFSSKCLSSPSAANKLLLILQDPTLEGLPEDSEILLPAAYLPALGQGFLYFTCYIELDSVLSPPQNSVEDCFIYFFILMLSMVTQC